ncbi:unnamed protein product [Sphagnum troendelagicum]|uniref:Secreted protein n=1 Tax=Sphagnum troendelagicum TaxID=128251 RepID=A0ABP0U2I9_9BRYO
MSPRDVASRSLRFLALFAVGRLLPTPTTHTALVSLHCTLLRVEAADLFIFVAGILSGHVDVPQRAWMIENGELVSKLKKNNNNNNKNVVHCSTVDNTPSGPEQKSPQL